MEIRSETFKAESIETTKFGIREKGTVKVIFNKQEILAKATRYNGGGDIYVDGFFGKYQTGTKEWDATVFWSETRQIVVAYFGRDERAGRCNKLRGIYYKG